MGLNKNWGKRVLINTKTEKNKKPALTGFLSSAFIGDVQQVEGDGHGTK